MSSCLPSPKLSSVLLLVSLLVGPAQGQDQDARGPDPQPVSNVDELLQAGFAAGVADVYRDAEGRYFRLRTGDPLADEDQGASIAGSDSYWLAPYEFRPINPSDIFLGGSTLTCPQGQGTEEAFATVHLPSGATIVGLEYFGSDTASGVADVNDSRLLEVCQPVASMFPTVTNVSALIGTTGPFSAGLFLASDENIDHPVDNESCYYIVRVNLGDNDCQGGNLSALKVRVRWRNMAIH